MGEFDYCPPGAKYPKCKYPEWIILLGVNKPNGKANLMPAGWALEIPTDPPLLTVSVGFTRYSYELMERSNCFSWIVPTDGMGADVYFCGTKSGRDLDKPDHLQSISIRPGRSLNVPLVEGALRNVECKLIGGLITGDHKMYVGRAVRDEYDPGKRKLMNFDNFLYAPAIPDEATLYKCGNAKDAPTTDPRWINIVTAANAAGEEEASASIPLSITSHSPAMVCIATKAGSRLERLIRESGHFAFSWPVAGMGKAVETLLLLEDKKADKFAEAGLERLPPKAGKAPLVGGSLCSVECKVDGILDLPGASLISGTVLEVHYFAPGPRLIDFGNGFFARAKVDTQRAWQKSRTA